MEVRVEGLVLLPHSNWRDGEWVSGSFLESSLRKWKHLLLPSILKLWLNLWETRKKSHFIFSYECFLYFSSVFFVLMLHNIHLDNSSLSSWDYGSQWKARYFLKWSIILLGANSDKGNINQSETSEGMGHSRVLDWATFATTFPHLESWAQSFSTEGLDTVSSKEILTWKTLPCNASQVISILYTLKPFFL